MALTDRVRTNGELPKLATRRRGPKPFNQYQFTSPDDLTQAVIAEVFDEDDDAGLFVDDVI